MVYDKTENMRTDHYDLQNSMEQLGRDITRSGLFAESISKQIILRKDSGVSLLTSGVVIC